MCQRSRKVLFFGETTDETNPTINSDGPHFSVMSSKRVIVRSLSLIVGVNGIDIHDHCVLEILMLRWLVYQLQYAKNM